ncbi:MAG: selenide, water dikinase SelD [Sphingobacteriales bacterium]|nr:selenide, water dikinase SelD [Sphingobacteriales bacterium]
MEEKIRLTQFSKGAGCGCKIAPNVLQEMLSSKMPSIDYPNLLVGNKTNDDAAVYDIGGGKSIISTTDFFMPIVDDAFNFGQIASANAISDVYAMGGKPLMAVAILGWPIEKLSTELAREVLDGARDICSKAGIPLAGGHTIDTQEPMFGLAVTGIVDTSKIKKNNTSQKGDLLFITKPIGVGILATAQKRDVIEEAHLIKMISQMTTLNSFGEKLGQIEGISAVTDVTGFGLLGHCIEMAEGADLSIDLFYSKIPVIEGAKEYLSKRIVPDATYRNWNSYSTKTSFEKGVNVMEAFNLLPDPQTNGGLLFSVNPNALEEVVALLKQNGLENFIEPIGEFVAKKEKAIEVKG